MITFEEYSLLESFIGSDNFQILLEKNLGPKIDKDIKFGIVMATHDMNAGAANKSRAKHMTTPGVLKEALNSVKDNEFVIVNYDSYSILFCESIGCGGWQGGSFRWLFKRENDKLVFLDLMDYGFVDPYKVNNRLIFEVNWSSSYGVDGRTYGAELKIVNKENGKFETIKGTDYRWELDSNGSYFSYSRNENGGVK